MDRKIERAAKTLIDGGIVIFPTDTAIGIGCRMDNKNAVEKLFKIRKRPEHKPMLVLVNSVKMAEKYLPPISQKVKRDLIKKYWPGPLTIIFKCNSDKVLFPVKDKRNTLAIRFPDNKLLQDLVARVGVSIVAPSANFTGEKTPFKFSELNKDLIKQVDYILEGEESNAKISSTIIDVSSEPWKIVRQGEKIFQIFNFLNILTVDTSDNKKISVGLNINGKKDIEIKTLENNDSQIVLSEIQNILKKHALKPEDISEIRINTGHGSYTGLRVGLAIANALSFALKIPVNGKKRIILPIYK